MPRVIPKHPIRPERQQRGVCRWRSGRIGRAVLLIVLVAAASPLAAQVLDEAKPAPVRPLSQAQQQEREALKLYALGLECVHEDRLLEAQKALEEAARLNPKAAAVFKALVPVYLALDRGPEALEASRKTLDLDPSDIETWLLYARQLRARGQSQQAIAALRKGLACPAAHERPDLTLQMYQDLGELCESARDYESAAAALTEAGKILEHPEALLELSDLDRDETRQRAADVYEHIGRIWLQARQPERAVAAFRHAQAAYPAEAARLGYNLAQVYAEQGKAAQALAALDAYLALRPPDRGPYELKIRLLDKLGRKDEIVPWLKQASVADKRNVGLALLYAQECRRADQPKEAERVYLSLAEQSPSAEVYRGLFLLYRETPALGAGQALALLDRTLKQARRQGKGQAGSLAPAQARAMLEAIRQDADLANSLLRAASEETELGHDTLYLMAVLADRGKQLDQAERFYRQALENRRPETEAQVYSGLLRVLAKARKYEEIVRVCRDGLKTSQATNHVLFYSDLALALTRLGKYDEAVAAADDAVRLAAGPDRQALRTLRVRVLIQAGRYDKAEAECRAMLTETKQPGEELELHYLLSGVYSSAGNYPKAEEQLQWILKADPANATAHNDLGYLWADQGKNLEEAEKLIRKALELDRQQRSGPALPPGPNGSAGPAADPGPDKAAYVDSLGWVLFRRGRFEEARRELERAVTLPDGDDPVLWDHLGDIYFRLGQTKRAQAAWRESLRLYEQEHRRELDQHYQDLRRKLQLLEKETQR
jgi:tetratricopeptide (TPR) repeat protein